MTEPETPGGIVLSHEPRFSLGSSEVRPATREWVGAAGSELLEPRIMQVLVALARRRGEVVSRDDLIAACWAGRVVGGDAIHRCIFAIRRLSRVHGGFAVTTVPRVGYRLDAPPGRRENLPVKPRVVVSAFDNLSDDPEHAFFAIGMADEIVRTLSRFKSIHVVGPRTAGTDVEPGARYLLQGSVLRGGARVRITLQLVNAGDGGQAWAESFEDALDDVFALQDRIALTVAARIEPAIRTEETRKALAMPTGEVGCRALCLRADALLASWDKADVFEALGLLEQAHLIDPRSAMAATRAAACHAVILSHRWSDDWEAHRRKGVEEAERSLRLAGDDPEVVANAAINLWQLGESLESSMDLMARAVTLNPGSSVSWHLSAVLHVAAGDPQTAIEHIERSVQLDPLSMYEAPRSVPLGVALFAQQRFEEAVRELMGAGKRVRMALALATLAASLGYLGRLAEAQQALADYRTCTDGPVTDMARFFQKQEHRELLRSGLARARRARG